MQFHIFWQRSLGAAVLVAAGSVCAQDRGVAQPLKPAAGADWRIQVTPYIWGTGLNGTVRPEGGGPSGEVDQSFGDVLKDLDAALFLNAIVRKDALVMSFDVMHASLSKAAEIDLAPGVALNGRAKMRQNSWSALVGYNWNASPRSSWDWLAGVRHWSVRATVRADLMGQGREATVRKAATDPVVAARWRYQWDDRWSTLAYMDVGGRTSGKQRTFQTLLTVNYAWQENWHVSLGYRYLNAKYDKDGTYLNFSQQGPIVGVSYRF